MGDTAAAPSLALSAGGAAFAIHFWPAEKLIPASHSPCWEPVENKLQAGQANAPNVKI